MCTMKNRIWYEHFKNVLWNVHEECKLIRHCKIFAYISANQSTYAYYILLGIQYSPFTTLLYNLNNKVSI